MLLFNRIAFRGHLCTGFVALLLGAWAFQPAWAGTNLLKDSGFEAYKLDRSGSYVPTPDAAWREITMGRGAVRFNASPWKAPSDMVREGPLRFSPGTTGWEGTGPGQNSGRLIFEQDVADLPRPAGSSHYEMWFWLGAAGRESDNGSDTMDECGGMQVFFYDNPDTSTWTEGNAVEHHAITKDFWGEPGSFVRVCGYGKLPAKARAARVRVWATTWGSASQPKHYDTEVAVDNAHFAVIDAPNLLINGDFEMDVREGEMKGWSCPAEWPFARCGMKPRRIINTFHENFDHGTYRPFHGGRWAYGYATYLDGWRKDGFSFGQHADYLLPPGTPLVLMFNWIQNVAEAGKAAQLRTVGTEVDLVLEYLHGRERVGAEGFHVDWPVPQGPGAVGRYDQNADTPYCPRFRVVPPEGTDRVGLHVNFLVNMRYRDGWCHVNAAIDDFYLGAETAAPSGQRPSTRPAERP